MHTTSLVIFSLLTAASVVTGLNLNVTALGAANGASTLECWQMNAPFSISTEAGTAGSASASLGGLANFTYAVIPAGYDGGLHNAPRNQLSQIPNTRPPPPRLLRHHTPSHPSRGPPSL